MSARTWYPEGSIYQPPVFPPGPPPLSSAYSNPNPPPWRGYQHHPSSGPKPSSSQTSSNRSAAAPSQRKMSSHPLQADLPDGGVFFEIGQNVRVRRYSPSKNSYSDWFDGTVVRPVAVEFDRMGKRLKSFQRRYMCLYDDPHYQEWIEREFSPELHEIASLDCPLIFAPIPVTNASGNKQVVYLPAMVLTSPNREGGVYLHILTGRPEAKREISNFAIQYARPYTQESALYLAQNRLPFMGDGIRRSF